MTWTCLGIPPAVQPCDAHGDRDTDAERHTRDTRHATTSGGARGVEAMRSVAG